MSSIPNILTALRIFLIPILVFSFFVDGVLSNWLAATLFGIASLTDFFDGYLARLLKAESSLGKLLDPIADKLLVTTALIMLIHFGDGDLLITIPAIIILFREIFVSGLREFLAEINVGLPVSKLAKWKTTVQMISLAILILGDKGSGIEYTDQLGRIGLAIAAFLTVITGLVYFKTSLKHIKG